MQDEQNLKELYQSLVLEHSKHPRNYGALEKGALHSIGHNASCGDHIDLFLKPTHPRDGCDSADLKHTNQPSTYIVEDIKFTGVGCALCISSASLMTKAIKGQSIEDAQTIAQEFVDFIVESKDMAQEREPLHIFEGVRKFPLRVKCVLLAWRTLQQLLLQSTEQEKGGRAHEP